MPSFWLVDPDKDHLAPTAFELDPAASEYREITHVTDVEPFDANVPFEVRVVPGDLVARLHP